MARDLLITGGRIIDPGQGIDTDGDLMLSDGKVAQIAGRGTLLKKNVDTLDAQGCIVCPGFIDLHCHLRVPGFEDKETIATGTQAAARGGFTTVCCMPNTNPPLDNRAVVEYVVKTAAREGAVRVLPIGCITKERKGVELSEMYDLAQAGVIGFSDDGSAVPDPQLMQKAMEYSSDLDLPIIEHCEDPILAKGGSMHEGWVSTRLGIKGISSAAEEVIVARDIALAKLTGARLHIAHASTAGSAEMIRRAREQGVRVTAEVTPHHLTLTHERVILKNGQGSQGALLYDTNAKVNPPLRTEDDVKALIEALKEGVIDCIVTDHGPHRIVDKLCEFSLAAYGISGFETAFGSLMTLVHNGRLDIKTMIAALTAEPSKILGNRYGMFGSIKPGFAADIVIFDPDKEWTVRSKDFVSKGKNTPLEGEALKGKVITTIYNGAIVYNEG